MSEIYLSDKAILILNMQLSKEDRYGLKGIDRNCDNLKNENKLFLHYVLLKKNIICNTKVFKHYPTQNKIKYTKYILKNKYFKYN